jgi:hypothetical protein
VKLWRANIDHVTLRLSVFGGVDAWPIYVIRDRGFLDVTITPTPGSMTQMQRMVLGKFDLAATAMDNVSLMMRIKEIRRNRDRLTLSRLRALVPAPSISSRALKSGLMSSCAATWLLEPANREQAVSILAQHTELERALIDRMAPSILADSTTFSRTGKFDRVGLNMVHKLRATYATPRKEKKPGEKLYRWTLSMIEMSLRRYVNDVSVRMQK